MKKKLLIALGVFVGLLLVLAVVVALQPGEFAVSRTGRIKAPPEAVFPHVNDFHLWQDWSPWAKLDPNAKSTFSGAESGQGAKFAWAGNDKVGEGNMEISESKPGELIRIRLEFIKPFAGVNDTLFTFKPEGDETVVTWTMSGKNDFIGKFFCLLMNMDKTLGGDFEKGLDNMKSIVEKQPAKPAE